MGTLSCTRCGASAEGKDFAEADSAIDHAIGLGKGLKCGGDPKNLQWNGKAIGEWKFVGQNLSAQRSSPKAKSTDEKQTPTTKPKGKAKGKSKGSKK